MSDEIAKRNAMDDAEDAMALESFGFGRWEAPYWFIGPEQGQGKKEGGSLAPRSAAWKQLGAKALCDCRDFHDLIPVTRWHCERPKLQSTWRPLMLLLMEFLDRPWDNDSLRVYQRDQWGRLHGETCVIELSGLPANSLKVPRNRSLYKAERINKIRHKLQKYKPSFVVMYGLNEKESWETIGGPELKTGNIIRLGSTLLVFTPHPAAHGLGKQYWIDTGRNLHKKYSESQQL
jgi:hypothetical protein